LIKNKKLLSIFKKNLILSSKDIDDLINGKINLELNKHAKWDSLMHVKIILKLEKTFKININEKNYLKFTNLKKIDNELKKLK
tara:strand:+ start:51 stop:299 length:249 start_codon:yes stop_codon:yes gene_type:complete